MENSRNFSPSFPSQFSVNASTLLYFSENSVLIMLMCLFTELFILFLWTAFLFWLLKSSN